MSEEILKACRDLINDAKVGCPNLVFKETCLEILFKARHVLSDEQFKQLVAYAAEKMKEKITFEVKPELTL
jgi:hypothetical protein